jgi:hypothetical protein
MIYYKEVDAVVPELEVLEGDIHPAQREMAASPSQTESTSGFPSTTLLLVLWIIGLACWYYCMVLPNQKGGSKRRSKGDGNSNKDK